MKKIVLSFLLIAISVGLIFESHMPLISAPDPKK